MRLIISNSKTAAHKWRRAHKIQNEHSVCLSVKQPNEIRDAITGLMGKNQIVALCQLGDATLQHIKMMQALLPKHYFLVEHFGNDVRNTS